MGVSRSLLPRLGRIPLIAVFLSAAAASAQTLGGPVEVTPEVKHDVSRPLREISATPYSPDSPHVKPLGKVPVQTLAQADPVVQVLTGPQVAVTNLLNFDGLGQGFTGPNGTFSVTSAPPDTNGAVGLTQYVQWVNTSFAVFNKTTGAVVLGPTVGNALWQGFGGGCESNNNGDPIAQYDKAANRWVMTQLSISTQPFLQCVAVSATSDATGQYFRYAFTQPNFNDYPKLGIWPDGYYITFNMFSGNTFLGARECAFDRTRMLTGLSATQICFQQSNAASLMPADLDGATPPTAGSPNFMLSFGFNDLLLYKFHVDFQDTV
jgi:hypothetical protein